MKFILLISIKAYKIFISPIVGQIFQVHCRFSKTCSEYAKEAIEKDGAFKGGKLAIKRFLSCQPLAKKYV